VSDIIKISEVFRNKTMSILSTKRSDGPFLILLPFVSMSGLELFGVRFAKDLLSKKIPAVIASPSGGLICERCRNESIPWLPMPVMWRFDPVGIYMLSQTLFALKPRAVVGFRTQTAYPLHLARLITRNHAPFFLFYRLGAGNQPRLDPLHRLLFRQMAAVVPNSDHVKNKILSKWAIDDNKVVCIKSGIDINKYQPNKEKRFGIRNNLGIPGDALVIGNTGRIHPEKGSLILLEALFGENGAAEKRKDIYLVYVGREYEPGYGDFLKKRAEELNARDRFFIVPFRNDVENIYPAFDIFTLAVTSHETYAYVVLEAMASGVVPIVPEIGGMKEMFSDGVEGFYFRHRDTESLIDVIRKALAMTSDARIKMSEAARKRMEKYANWDEMMEKYFHLFKSLGISIC